jgi:hypothetical protein
METTNDYASPQPTSTPWVKLLLSWIVVIVPAAWGVSQTVQKSLPLFTSAPGATSAAAASTAPSMAPNLAAPATAPR